MLSKNARTFVILLRQLLTSFCPTKNSKTKVAILTSDKIGKTYMHTLCGKEDMDVIVTTEQTD